MMGSTAVFETLMGACIIAQLQGTRTRARLQMEKQFPRGYGSMNSK